MTSPTTQRRAAGFTRRGLLRWLYMGRVAVVSGIEVGALLRWLQAAPEQTLVATAVFSVTLLFTGFSFWYSHVVEREVGVGFAYAQVIFDVVVVTAIVHITGGASSFFAPLYILVITTGALLLPLPGGVLIGALASVAYFGDITWGQGGTVGGAVAFQILIFAGVALATGWLGDRVRRAGIALGAVESELRQLRLDTADILGTVSTGVVTVNGEGLLAYMNPAAENLLGLSASASTGAPAFSAIEGIAPGLGTLLRRSLQDRIPMARYKTVARVGDRTITLGVTTTVLEREGGGAPSVTAIFQDITELDRVDELNRRNERLEALAELSASLAHEIKNPLASIRSAVEQIADPELEDEDRSTLQRLVEAESDRLSRLLSEFIDFSRLRIGKLEEVDLVRVCEDCATLVRQHPSFGDGAKISVEYGDRAPPVHGDSDLLHRALFNLVLNGVQFAGPSGRVKVTLARSGGKSVPRGSAATGTSPVGGAAARIVIEDSGPGVEEELASRIFDPFFTTREGGSGLGLPVAHRTIEAHQGTIMVDRSDLGGARFTIDLPINRVGSAS